MNFPILSTLTFLPLLGAFLVLLLPKEAKGAARGLALIVSLAVFGISLGLLGYQPELGGMQYVESYEWLPSWGVQWKLGLDGLSLWLVLLTTFLGPIVVAGAWTAVDKRDHQFFAHILALETFMLGAFFALNLAVFYVFWELMLVPMFFLIGVWGGNERIYATVKFVIYTVVGSMLMLAAILYLYWLHHEQFAVWSLDFADLYLVKMGLPVQTWLFAGFAISFAVKVPLFPVHTWLPDAHTQAPTAGSVILAGVLLKMGTYGFLRLAMPLFPGAVAEWGWLLQLLAVIGIVYGALVAMVQPDIKRLVAYSSVSHMGYIMLGIFALNPQGVQGGIYQMLSHGISTGALFLAVGVVYERTHTRKIVDYGGLAKTMPIYATVFLIVALSSAGLPGTNGFIGEFLILMGAFYQGHMQYLASGSNTGYLLVAGAGTGLILGAFYLLWMIERVFFGPVVHDRVRDIKDMTLREVAVFVPLIVMIFWMGVYPQPFLDRMAPSVDAWIADMEAGKLASADWPDALGTPAMPTLEAALADAELEVGR